MRSVPSVRPSAGPLLGGPLALCLAALLVGCSGAGIQRSRDEGSDPAPAEATESRADEEEETTSRSDARSEPRPVRPRRPSRRPDRPIYPETEDTEELARFARSRPRAILEQYAEQRALVSRSSTYYRDRGERLLAEGKPAEAARAYLAAVVEDPKDERAREGLRRAVEARGPIPSPAEASARAARAAVTVVEEVTGEPVDLDVREPPSTLERVERRAGSEDRVPDPEEARAEVESRPEPEEAVDPRDREAMRRLIESIDERAGSSDETTGSAEDEASEDDEAAASSP